MVLSSVKDALTEVLEASAIASEPAVASQVMRPFSPVEDLMVHLDTPAYPWTIQIEVRAPGPLDEQRVRAAGRAAIERHPMARCRRTGWRPWDHTYTWEQQPVEQIPDPVSVAMAATDDEMAAIRAALLSERVPIESAPTFRLQLVRRPGGDTLLLSASHVATDGMGALRLMRSIVRHYAGRPDPADPVTSDDALRVLDPSSPLERLSGLAGFAAASPAQLRPPARIAVQRTVAPLGDEPAFAFGGLTVSAAARAAIDPRRHVGDATFNDVLLAALHLAIEDWNADRRAATGRIGVMMPINLRPRSWWHEVMLNLSSVVTVSTCEADRNNAASLVRSIVRQTSRIKRTGAGRGLTQLLGRSPQLPVAVKQLLPAALPLTGARIVDTSVLSNLGRIDEPFEFGPGEVATEVWFSPPARSPLGVGVGALTHDGRLHLMIRGCADQVDQAGVTTFGGYLLRALEFVG